jgi:hypothetical protein
VDGSVRVAVLVEHLLVERAHEGAGASQPADEFVAKLVTSGGDLHEFDVEAAALQFACDGAGLPQRQVRPPRRQTHPICHARSRTSAFKRPPLSAQA